jgi:hypothetical protein
MAKKILVKGTKGPRLMTEAAFKIAQKQFGAMELKQSPVELKRPVPPEIKEPVKLKELEKPVEIIKSITTVEPDKPKRKSPVKSKSTK